MGLRGQDECLPRRCFTVQSSGSAPAFTMYILSSDTLIWIGMLPLRHLLIIEPFALPRIIPFSSHALRSSAQRGMCPCPQSSSFVQATSEDNPPPCNALRRTRNRALGLFATHPITSQWPPLSGPIRQTSDLIHDCGSNSSGLPMSYTIESGITSFSRNIIMYMGA